MGAETPARRTRSAREGAEQLGVSPRKVRNRMPEPRAEYEARAAERRRRVLELRAEGLKLREIADEVGITVGGVGTILHRAYKAEAERHTPSIVEQVFELTREVQAKIQEAKTHAPPRT
ncbi:sigma factor-like helix-turn-helix DNA-binding protein [Rhodococcus sp. NPDC055112]